MMLPILLTVAAALIGVGLWGALAQQTFVMIMMGIELLLNGVLLATVAFWAYAAGGTAEGQLLVIIGLLVMAVEMAVGFALVIAIYRRRQVDMTEGAGTLQR